MGRRFSPEGEANWRPDRSDEGEAAEQRRKKRGADQRRPKGVGAELPPPSLNRLKELQRKLDTGTTLDAGEQEQYDAFVGIVGAEQWERAWETMPRDIQEGVPAEASEDIPSAEATSETERATAGTPAETAVEAAHTNSGDPDAGTSHEPATEPTIAHADEGAQEQPAFVTRRPRRKTRAGFTIRTADPGKLGLHGLRSDPELNAAIQRADQQGIRTRSENIRTQREERPRFTTETDPSTLDQKGLYQFRSYLEKNLTGPEQEAAIQRVDQESRRRGGETRAQRRSTKGTPSVEIPDGTFESPADALPPHRGTDPASEEERRRLLESIGGLIGRSAEGVPVNTATSGSPDTGVVLPPAPGVAERLRALLNRRRAEGTSTDTPTEEPASPEVREAELDPLAEKRNAYAKALRSQSNILRFWNRAGKKELERTRSEYHTAIAEHVKQEIETIKAELGDAAVSDPTKEGELNARITDLILNERFVEGNILLDATKEAADTTWGQHFQYFWKKHAKARLIVSGVLMGASIAALATPGGLPAALIIQGIRVPLSGIGTTFGVESAIEMARGKFGATKELSDDQIKELSDEELEQRLAAHETRYTEVEGEFGTQRRLDSVGFRGWKPSVKTHEDTTGQRLLGAYRERKSNQLREYSAELKGEGKTPDQITARLLEVTLDEERAHHEDLESQRARDRRQAIIKWTASIALGATASLLSLGSAARLAGKMADATSGHDAARDAKEFISTPRDDTSVHADQPHAVKPETPHMASAHGHGTQGVPDSVRTAAPDTTRVETPVAASSDTTHVAATPDTAQGTAHAAQAPDTTHPSAAHAETTHSAAAGHTATPDTAHVAPSTTETTGTPGHENVLRLEAVDKEHLIEPVKSGGNLTEMIEKHLPPEIQKLHETAPGRYENVVQNLIRHAMKEKLISFTDADGQVHELTNPDQISAQWKSVDLTKVFAGDRAANLEGLKDHAEHLSQAQVSHIEEIVKANQEWINEHPHEAFDPAKVEAHLHDQLHNGSPEGASVSDVVTARETHDAMLEFWRRFGENLVAKDPTQYDLMMANSPEFKKVICEAFATDDSSDLEPVASTVSGASTEVSGGISHVEHITLPSHFGTALETYGKTVSELFSGDRTELGMKIMKNLDGLDARAAMKKGVVDAMVDHMEGGTHDVAKKIGKAVRELLKKLPIREIHDKETLGHVLERVRESK